MSHPGYVRRTALLVICAILSFTSKAQQTGILREVYEGISGNAVTDLTGAPIFPGNPTAEFIENVFEAPTNFAENYGQRMRALITAPATGAYTFWIASDDNSALYLSTDEDPAKKVQIAFESGWTNSREWTKDPNQKSAAITLTQGKRYYIEALQKEGGGGDNLAVRWQLPNGTIEEPIPGSRMIPYGLTAPIITAQPVNVTTVEGGQATFTFQLARFLGATYRWQKNGQDVQGETNTSIFISPALLTDNNALFQCFITNPYGTTNTVQARLIVNADVTRPTLVGVGSLGDPTIITLIFSEPLDPVSASNKDNYGINQGVTVNAARLGQDGRTVTLTTTTHSPGVTYAVTVNNVKDKATNPNTIQAGSQMTYNIDSKPLAIGLLRPSPDPMGPSSRHTPLAISEIMYHPAPRTDGRNVEYIEIYNSQPWAEDISGFRFSGAVDFTIPQNTSLGAQRYLVIAAVPDDVKAVYAITNVMGGFVSQLRDTPGKVRLFNRFGAELLTVDYNDDFPWPAAADGAGHSLILARPTLGEQNPKAWDQSDVVGGSPGRAETVGANPLRTVLINEFLAHTDDPDLDYIELYNYSATAVDISGCILTDDPSTNRFVIPPNTMLGAGGFIAFDQSQLGFSLSSEGEFIFLKNPAGTRVLDSYKFDGQENGVSTGRYPDGAPDFRRLLTKTKGGSNSRPRESDVVINEIMFAPVSDDSDDEYIELYNRSANPVNIGKWRLTSGVGYTFPLNTVIAPDSYLVIGRNVARLLTNYPNLNGANTLGNYSGSLANSGDRVALSMPDEVVSTNSQNQRVTNIIHIAVDEVTYGPGGRWGTWTKGGGSSLELIDPRTDKDFASNWADSDEADKSGWTTIEHTGVLDHGNDNANSLQIIALRGGEYLIDNVEVIPSGGQNIVSNPGFENGMTGWVPQGNHERSTIENTGFNSARSLHLRATAHGDTGANRIRTTFTQGLSSGQTVTIRAKVKWLHGHQEILFRLHGNWLEATGEVLQARNLGTPGARNSRAKENSAPAISDVTHSPAAPTATQPVTVLARVTDPDGLASLVLKYRIDPSTNVTLLNMANNGAGLYSAVIPAQAAGTLAAFRIEAADNFTPSAASTFPTDAPARECLVRWGDPVPSANLGTYRLWMTKAKFDRWSSREKLSNEPIDCTFVYGNQRVIYNMGGQYSGSPYHAPGFNTPTGNVCDYVLNFPEDDLFLGETDMALSWPGNGGGDNTYQREDTAYWIGAEIGLPFSYRRHVNLYVNGSRRAEVFQDVQQPNSDMVEEFFPNGVDGDLYKIQLWFEFDDAASAFTPVGANLGNYTTTGGQKKLARYRWNWAKRGFKGSANNYTNLFALVDAVNTSATGDAYTRQFRSVVDVENWVRTYAVEHIVGNNDSYAYGGGQNMYTYKPQDDTWKLMIWDIDFAFAAAASNSDLFSFGGGGVGPNMDHAPFRRAYWQALYDAANGPLLASRSTPLLDAKYNALRAAGANVESPDSIKNYISQRRSYILSLLNTVGANFAVTTGNGADFSTTSNSVTLRGTAPIPVRSIRVNGVDRPIIWTTITNWSISLALSEANNPIAVTGHDAAGNLISGSSNSLTITYTGAIEAPENKVVFNEIMYNPAIPDSGFLELHNTSTTTSFDLTGWRVQGIDFNFTNGTIISPGGFLLLTANAAGFSAANGPPRNFAGQYDGSLANEGETLRLLRPDTNGVPSIVVDEVTYSSAAPWPTAANGTGSSLQLIDPLQDNNRPGNWVSVFTAPTPTPQWQYITVTANAGSSSRLYIYMGSAGDVYLDDLKMVAGAEPEVGSNLIANGEFESALAGSWNVSPNLASSALSTTIKHSGNSSLHVIASSSGASQDTAIWKDCSPALVSGQPYTMSFWFLQNTNGGTLTIRLSGNAIARSVNISPGGTVDSAKLTPGLANSTRATLPAFPTLWINEILPDNQNGATDVLGHRHPWVELFNGGTNAVSLAGLYLSPSYSNLTRWALPAAASIPAGQFAVVWLDGNTAESTATEWHANFTVPAKTGSIALTRVQGTQTNVVDFMNYDAPVADRSYGSYPDGLINNRRRLYIATPGATNNPAIAPINVVINEWMADNTRTMADPSDGQFQDWFELLNLADEPADLNGHYLTDTTGNVTQFPIPQGFVIPAHGRLIVWADDETEQNVASTDLHVNFKLEKGGESIALYSPERVLINLVNFGKQTNDISQGRFPDGVGGVFYMTNATPRLANLLGGTATNTAPNLAAIADVAVWEGQLVTMTFVATDSDTPAQNLAFTLEAGAPEGATINRDTGLFSWRAGAAAEPTAFTIGVRLTDDGAPPLSVSRTFKITVLPTPRFTSALLANGQISLTWNLQTGKRYQLQFAEDLSVDDPVWLDVGAVIDANSPSVTVLDNLDGDRRFYRIVEVLLP